MCPIAGGLPGDVEIETENLFWFIIKFSEKFA
jgi:hypothetical protein